jgi:hypothetical protein
MAIKLSSIRRDVARETEGDWVEIPELIDPATGETPAFRVRGLGYGPFSLAVSAMRGRLQRRYGAPESIPNDAFHREHGKLLAQHILLDWRGVSEPYTRDLAEEILCDPASPVQLHCIRCSSELSEVAQAFDSDAAKNSEPASAGSSKDAKVRLAG